MNAFGKLVRLVGAHAKSLTCRWWSMVMVMVMVNGDGINDSYDNYDDDDDDDNDGDGDLLPLALLQKPMFPRQLYQSLEPILPVLNLISWHKIS